MMVKFKRIALFSNDDNVQVLQLLGLKRGFEQIGIECFASWPLPKAPQLEAFLDVWKPDVVFEFDRSRNQIEADCSSALHVSWVQNARNFGVSVLEGAGGSDLVYYCLQPERLGVKVDPGSCRWLFPGADESIFFPDDSEPYRFDLSLCGFLHSVVSPDFLNGPIVVDGQRCCTVQELLDEIIASGLYGEYGYDLQAIHDLILFRLKRSNPRIEMKDLPQPLLELFETRFYRLYRRRIIAESMLASTGNVAFCGRNSWLTWPQFAPFYRGDKTRPSELARIYRQTRLNVHECPLGLHHRTMEVMACARPLLIGYSYFCGTPCDIANFFTPGEDFIWYSEKNFVEVAREALADPVRLQKIGRNAYEKVMREHLWRHRAEQIVRDLSA